MIVIKVWCLPSDQSEDDLNRLHQAIVKAAVSISELCLRDENDMTCLFPADLMKYGLGEEIIVEIDDLPDISRSERVRIRLAECVGKSISALYPKARIECSVRSLDPSRGVWTSAKPNCGCEGSCPVCRTGEVDDHKCNRCGAEFCSKCHGIANDVKSENVLPCKCESD